MAAHKFNTAQREAHLLTVADMYLTGSPQSVIAEKVGVSRQMIGAYLNKLQKRWQVSANEAIDARKARELARLDRLEREYWLAWERSQKDAEVARQRQVGDRKTAELTKKGQAGDPRFLLGVMQCIEMRLKIIGGFAPAKVDIAWKEALDKHGVDASTIFEELVQSADERAAAAVSGGSADDGAETARAASAL